jgi:hypothetical protein
MRLLAVAALALAGLPVRASHAQEPAAQAVTASPGPAEIARAIETVKADPNLAAERTMRTLEWRNPRETPRSGNPAWLAWVSGLFGWLEQSARLLVWSAAGLLAVMAAVMVVRLSRMRAGPPDDTSFAAPTHVRDLDIRPETLPDDIGSAARALWDRGDHRASLALLYRGLLSRLVHVHQVAIRDSSTEGDCLALAAKHLTRDRHEYAAWLVAVWQRAVYGREAVTAEAVYSLCDGFARALGPARRPDAAGAAR